MNAVIGLLLSVVLASPAAGWKMYLRRAGPVRIGMSGAQLRGVLNVSFSETGCSYAGGAATPAGVGVMLQDGIVVRIDVRQASAIRTASGAGIGDTEEKIKATYPGRIRVAPHKYDPAGHYLVYEPVDAADRAYGMIFETNGKRVTSFRAGLVNAVALVEGCS